MKIHLLAAAGLLLTAGAAGAAVRTWTDDLNRTWQGEFLRMDGPAAVFLVNGRESPFPLARLSAADKVLIFKLRSAPPPVAPAPGPAAAPNDPAATVAGAAGGSGKAWNFGSVKLEPGDTVETDLPLSTAYSQTITRAYGAKSPVTQIRASLAVPVDFDGDKPQKLFIGVATASGDALSIPTTRNAYVKDALAHGYVVLAADGPDGKPKTGAGPGAGDSPNYRLTLLKVALEELVARFPKAKTEWSVVTGGFSGGCGYAGHEALWLSTQGWRVNGILMLNCNYPPTMWEHDPDMRGNTSRWHQIPAFFSWGEKDTIAPPALIKTAIETTKRGGYQKVRAESHPGGHEVWDAHVNLALDWFDSLARPAAR